MKSKILIVGAGNLGSRHLQGLTKLNRELEIYISDPSQDSLAIARERFKSVNTRSDITLNILESIKNVPKEIDIAIVATTADVRLNVIKQMIDVCSIKKMLLEKVLFQDLRDYEEAKNILNEKADNIWVNCAQRLWPFFKELKSRYSSEPNLRIEISGSNWGLGCNSVHNIDIAQYLWGDKITHEANLDPIIKESKRTGFKEFTGEIITRNENGGYLNQISYAKGFAPFIINASHPTENLKWNLTNNKLYISNEESNWEIIEQQLIAPYQSELTTNIIEDMLNNRECGLPNFTTSARIHVETIKEIINGMKRKKIDLGTRCPIT
jgi:hypothetical protein